jgi:hypothetical protein
MLPPLHMLTDSTSWLQPVSATVGHIGVQQYVTVSQLNCVLQLRVTTVWYNCMSQTPSLCWQLTAVVTVPRGHHLMQ